MPCPMPYNANIGALATAWSDVNVSPSIRGSPLPSSASIAKKMADWAGIVRQRSTISSKDSSLVQMNCSRPPNRPNSRFISCNQNCSTCEAPTTTMTVRVSGRRRRISSIISAGSCCVATVVSLSVNVPFSTKRRSTPAMSIGVAGKSSWRNCCANVAAGPPIVMTRSSLSATNRGPYALRNRDIGCLTARARRLYRYLDELDRLARRSDQIPHERVGKAGLRRERALGGRQHQHMPGRGAGHGRQRAAGAATPQPAAATIYERAQTAMLPQLLPG